MFIHTWREAWDVYNNVPQYFDIELPWIFERKRERIKKIPTPYYITIFTYLTKS